MICRKEIGTGNTDFLMSTFGRIIFDSNGKEKMLHKMELFRS
jgi:hypothetical protein